jgi:membrane protease YdiL (CAAX protease family)
MKKENALKVVLVSLTCPLLFVVLPILVNVVFQLVYVAIHASERQTDYNTFVENAQAAIAANSDVFTLVGIVLFFVIVLIVFKVRGKNLLERLQWNPVPNSVYGLVAIAAVTGILSANLLVYTVLPNNVLEDAADYASAFTSGGILPIAIAVLFAPIAEETVFRGFMMARLHMGLPIWFAVALSTLVFSIGHYAGGIGQLLGTAWLGVFFCLVFLWTKSLRASVLAHTVNNVFALFLPDALYIAMSLPAKLILFAVGLTATVFILNLIYKRRDKGNVAAVE